MRKLEVLWELPECDIETQREEMQLNGASRLARGGVAASRQSERHTVSGKRWEAQRTEVRPALEDNAG